MTLYGLPISQPYDTQIFLIQNLQSFLDNPSIACILESPTGTVNFLIIRGKHSVCFVVRLIGWKKNYTIRKKVCHLGCLLLKNKKLITA